ncbi:MAG TPA: lamin tail domain-containing protein [Flexivirga sp.]|uniref:lamin tail domain-containing protein n=1 Tax=Flexivirga sp. TaxID=1962927 RepID=UPI002C625431|nr:lamin tail domain-containing protein [Flexivirga sp.]HWC20829.1 lamin tail domain-containing protein [Flexivirga sp.]
MPQLPTRPRITRVRLVTLLATSALAVGGPTCLAVTPAHAASNSVVISAVYGGGGNSGAPYQNDYIELYNGGSTAVDLSGWSLAYYSSTGGSGGTTSLTGSIAPGGHFLVQEGAGSASAAPLPIPDATGTLNMSASKGSVVLAHGDATVDTVGYGAVTSSYVEGSTAPGITNTTADSRTKGCVDTDDNSKDFVAADPKPLNSTAPIGVCGTDGNTQPPPTGTSSTIEQIQGTGFQSPLAGEQVKDIKGIVTALNGGAGFWIQSTTPDDDPRTSEGLYVFGGAGMVKVGDDVTVAGKVSEYRPGGVSNGNLTTTELGSPNIQVNSSGNALPTAVEIGSQGHVPPAQVVEQGDPGNVEQAGLTLDPQMNALDFWESLEGMRIQETDAKAVGPTATSYGETPIVPANTKDVTWTPDGGVLYRSYDTPNAMRLILSDALLPKDSIAPANTGDTYQGVTAGVLDYNFGNFTLLATEAGQHKSGGTTRDVTTAPSKQQAAVATFNVENLAPSDPQSKFDRLAGQITTNLASPDVLAIEEIQDNTGATDDGTVDSAQTTDKLIAAIKAAGGPAYQAKWIDPVNDQDGGQPGGNIRSVFLYRTDRGMSFVDKPGGTPTNSVAVTGNGPTTSINYSPGRIDPTNAAWDDSRKPLVGEFRWQGKPLFVIANHFNSKGGDDGIMGRYQPPQRSSEVQRHAQATAVRGFIDDLLTANKKANVIVLGDLNDFNFSETANIVKGSGKTAMTDLIDTLPANERYSYDYQGNSQVLDQLLVSPALAKKYDYQVVHTNSQFYDQDSDHDPQIVKLQVH